jgi:secreted PhoX family phosphatase
MLPARRRGLLAAILAVTLTIPSLSAGATNGGFDTAEDPMVVGDSVNTNRGWSVDPILTVGEVDSGGQSVNAQNLGYELPGILDGIGAFKLNGQTVRVLVNHEFGDTAGPTYQLANGFELKGARISYVDIDRKSRKAVAAGLAFDTIVGRAGTIVDSADDLDYAGLNRFCSGSFYEPGQFGRGRGFADPLYLTNEEQSSAFGGPGGSFWVLDPSEGTLYALPDLGRGSWENATLVDTGRRDTIALLLGDDHGASASTFDQNPSPPLYLYVGKKDRSGDFVERNGLSGGQLYVWKTDSGAANPSEGFKGTGDEETGYWVPLTVNKGSGPGYTADGYAIDATLRKGAVALGAFRFSRPEDLATNPEDGTEAVFTSTGRAGILNDSDVWGDTYRVDIDFDFDDGVFDPDGTETKLTILYDGDDPDKMQEGLRSPDNLDWADDGYVYVQEDDSVGFAIYEASMWRLDPDRPGRARRILEIDRGAIPTGQSDSSPADVGNWETSGVLDVSRLFKAKKGETLLILDVQAHSLGGGLIASAGLGEGGQLVFASDE